MSSDEKNYRFITGPDDDQFCFRVSEARREGWDLYGNPVIVSDGDRVIVG